jgi:hypothetical protein
MVDYGSFWDELEKIAFEIPEGAKRLMESAQAESDREHMEPMRPRDQQIQIRPGMMGRLVRYGLPTAGAIGLGYATARLVGRPLSRYLMSKGVGPRAETFLRYALPIGAGLGAGYTLAGRKLMDELQKKIVEGDDDDIRQQNTGR